MVPSDTGAPRLSEHCININDPPSLTFPSSFLQVQHPKRPFLPHTPPSSRHTNTTEHVCVRSFSKRRRTLALLYLPHPYAQPSFNILTLFGGGSRFVPHLRLSGTRSLKLPQYHHSTLLKRPRDLRRIPQLTGTSGQKIRCVINTCRTRYNSERIRIIAGHRHWLWYIQTKRTVLLGHLTELTQAPPFPTS